MNKVLAHTSVLVVDDNADILEVLSIALEGAGASVVAVQTVQAAIETFRKCPPHAVIADIRLGTTDGYELIKTIREYNTRYRGFTPAVAVTGFASPEDAERAIAAGFSAYLPKPFDPAEVVLTVVRVLRGSADLAA